MKNKKNIIKTKLYDVLQSILQDDSLQLFHAEASKYCEIYENVTKSAKTNPNEVGVNMVRFDDKFYRADANVFQVVNNFGKHLVTDLPDQIMYSKDTFYNIIDDVKELIMHTIENKKYIKFFQILFMYENVNYLLYDFFHQIFMVERKENIKLTFTCKNLAETIIRFILLQTKQLYKLFYCFDYKQSLSLPEPTKNYLLNIVQLLFDNDTKKFDNILLKENIIDKAIYPYVNLFLKDILIKHSIENQIYIPEISKFVMKYHQNDPIELLNTINKKFVSLGYFLIDIFVHKKALIIQECKSKKSKDTYKCIVLAENIYNDFIKKAVNEKPILVEEQINNFGQFKKFILNSSYKFIHENAKIKVSLTDNSYLRTTTLYTRLSINIDYLVILLNIIKSNEASHKTAFILNLYNLETTHTDLLENIKVIPHFTQFFNEFINYLADFNSLVTPQHFINSLDQDLMKQFQKEGSTTQSINNMKQQWYSYKQQVHDLINKVFNRKIIFVKTIQSAINFSKFKYFIHTNYMDARGRVYSSGTYLNILTNNYAKLIVNLYDINEGASLPVNSLKIIESALIFDQTKKKVKDLQWVDLNTIHVRKIYSYIKTYLNITNDAFNALLTDDKYLDSFILLDELRPYIKKFSKLLYIHSLIIYEQLRKRNKHNRLILNYIQKDASSSGMQVLSCFFRDPKLAKVSNLMGQENYDIYMKATENCYLTYNQLRLFVTQELITFQSKDILDDNRVFDGLIIFQELALSVTKFGLTDCLRILRDIDLKQSIGTRAFLLNIIREYLLNNNIIISNCLFILPYLSVSTLNFLDTLKGLDEFREYNKELEYIFCLKYAMYLICVVERILKIPNSFWNNRNLTKSHVMTTLYNSTAYGRKEVYIELIKESINMHEIPIKYVENFAEFIEKCTSNFLNKEIELQTINNFAAELCNNRVKPLIINQRNLNITLDPRITEKFQISCTSYTSQRGPQLVIKKITKILDNKKLLSMFLANLAHCLDAEIMHQFSELCITLDKKLAEEIKYHLTFERNHDCFLLNHGALLEIFIEEAYLRFCKQDNITSIQGLTDEQVKKYTKMSIQEFLAILNPINPNFVK
jgi:hypothetical protein